MGSLHSHFLIKQLHWCHPNKVKRKIVRGSLGQQLIKVWKGCPYHLLDAIPPFFLVVHPSCFRQNKYSRVSLSLRLNNYNRGNSLNLMGIPSKSPPSLILEASSSVKSFAYKYCLLPSRPVIIVWVTKLQLNLDFLVVLLLYLS